jgi:hypothetical protein
VHWPLARQVGPCQWQSYVPDLCWSMSTLMVWTSDHVPLAPCVASTDVELPGAVGTVTGLPGVVRSVVDAIIPTLVWRGTITLVGAEAVLDGLA